MDRRFPKFDNKIDPKAEREINLSLQRMYDFIDQLERDLKKEIKSSSDTQTTQIQQASQLVNEFGTRLIGLENPSNPIETIGTGSVSSVGLTLPNIFNVTNSPIVDSGNLTATINGVNFKARVISDAQIRYTSTNADPTLTEFPNDKDFGFHVNTVSTNRFFVYNNGGTLFKVQIT